MTVIEILRVRVPIVDLALWIVAPVLHRRTTGRRLGHVAADRGKCRSAVADRGGGKRLLIPGTVHKVGL